MDADPPLRPARHRVALMVLNGSMALDLAAAVMVFGRRPPFFQKIRVEPESPYELVLCGRALVGGRSLGFDVANLQPFEQVITADTVIIPGLDDPARQQDPQALAAIAAAAENGARLISLCGGAFVLGQAGVLKGRRVTTHWALADEFREQFPDVELIDQDLFVDDGTVLSSGGMLAAADLCLHVLAQDHGQSYANDLARLIVSPPYRSGGQSQYRKPLISPAHGKALPVLDWVLDHLDEPLTLSSVAEQAHVSPRTLARRVRAETGQSLLSWIMSRRVERARALLEDSDLTVTQIAFTTGFGSTESLRRHFALSTGVNPRAYRETFRAGGAQSPDPTAGSGELLSHQ